MVRNKLSVVKPLTYIHFNNTLAFRIHMEAERFFHNATRYETKCGGMLQYWLVSQSLTPIAPLTYTDERKGQSEPNRTDMMENIKVLLSSQFYFHCGRIRQTKLCVADAILLANIGHGSQMPSLRGSDLYGVKESFV